MRMALSGAMRENFNPRSREGSDLASSGFSPASPYFNPRSREGSDDTAYSPGQDCTHFNPLSREGSDTSCMHLS